MKTAVVIMLIVLFGAALMGKMLKVLYPGSVFGSSKGKNAEGAE
ncbi:hypothetical protein [Roseovarius sp. 2305UL8-3]